MKLWQVRLSRVSELEADRFCEDLARNHSIIRIGYGLSKDVSKLRKENEYNDYVNILRKQLRDDHPRGSNETEKKYTSRIASKLGVVKQFMKIEKGDYIISPYYSNPNGGKISIGHVTGETETFGKLIGNKLNSFAQNYRNKDDILASANNLALKVEWDAELFEKDLLFDDKIKEKIKSRLTLISLDFSGELPYCLAPKNVFTQPSGSIQRINSNKARESTLSKFKIIKEKITHNWIIAVATFILAIIAVLEYIS